MTGLEATSSKGLSSEHLDFLRMVATQDYPAIAERYLYIQTKDRGLQPFKLWPMQMERARHRQERLVRREPIRELDIKYRQGGSSIGELAFAYLFGITHSDVNVLIMAHEKGLPTELLDRIRVFIKHMPDWCGPVVTKDSASEIVFGNIGSSIRIGTGRAAMEGSGVKLGRTIHYLLVTEASDPAWKTDSFRMLFQTVPLNTGVIIVETTAKGARGWVWGEWTNDDSIWDKGFWTWNYQPEYGLPVRGALKYTPEEELVVRQLGLSQEQVAFRRFKIKEIGERSFRELYPEDDVSCFLLSGSQFFPADNLYRQLQATGDNPGGRVDLRATGSAFPM